jgi:hypothetical protein
MTPSATAQPRVEFHECQKAYIYYGIGGATKNICRSISLHSVHGRFSASCVRLSWRCRPTTPFVWDMTPCRGVFLLQRLGRSRWTTFFRNVGNGLLSNAVLMKGLAFLKSRSKLYVMSRALAMWHCILHWTVTDGGLWLAERYDTTCSYFRRQKEDQSNPNPQFDVFLPYLTQFSPHSAELSNQRKQQWPTERYCRNICTRLRKTTNTHHGIWSQDWHFSPDTPEYTAGVPTARPRRSARLNHRVDNYRSGNVFTAKSETCQLQLDATWQSWVHILSDATANKAQDNANRRAFKKKSASHPKSI